MFLLFLMDLFTSDEIWSDTNQSAVAVFESLFMCIVLLCVASSLLWLGGVGGVGLLCVV